MEKVSRKDIQAATDWFFSGEVGVSSETICRSFLGKEQGRHHDGMPLDCDDLSRCRLFLERLSPRGQRQALAAVSERYLDWKPLAARWSEVCALMDQECPKWRNRGGSRAGDKSRTLIGVLTVEGLRLRYPKAEIRTYKDGTLSYMNNPQGPTTAVLRAEDFKK